VRPEQVIGIGTDFTACTVLPVLADGTPLCELPGLAGRPHAYVKLWRHHAAQAQADRITDLAAERKEPWLARYGGKISSEWEFAKALRLLEEDPELYALTDRWLEAADWIVWRLCGTYVRNACTAGYKGQLQDGAYPSREYSTALNPGFATFVRAKLEHPIGQLGDLAGRLTAEAAAWTGLPEGIAVCVGNVDAHVTAPASPAPPEPPLHPQTRPRRLLRKPGDGDLHVTNAVRHAQGGSGRPTTAGRSLRRKRL
jgi:L-ribulokinase